jgi:DNA repair photolyase
MKEFNGKAIYNPKGKAAEYSKWACNFYVGCSNRCTYCYLKKGRGAKVLGGDKPELKKCFKDENHAIDIFTNEALKNKDDLQKHGLFFSFTTDPMIKETKNLTIRAIHICNELNIPVKVLTKKTGFLYLLGLTNKYIKKELIAIGVTLTGYDESEPKASSNEERIKALKWAKETGYKTFVSIEPIISFELSIQMISESLNYVDLYKIGLESGKIYDQFKGFEFVDWLRELRNTKIYLKESIRNLIPKYTNEMSPCFVDRDFNIFKN